MAKNGCHSAIRNRPPSRSKASGAAGKGKNAGSPKTSPKRTRPRSRALREVATSHRTPDSFEERERKYLRKAIDNAADKIRKCRIASVESALANELKIGMEVNRLLRDVVLCEHAVHEVALQRGVGEAILHKLGARAAAFAIADIKDAIIEAVDCGYPLNGTILDACADESDPEERAKILSRAIRFHMSARDIRTEIGVAQGYREQPGECGDAECGDAFCRFPDD